MVQKERGFLHFAKFGLIFLLALLLGSDMFRANSNFRDTLLNISGKHLDGFKYINIDQIILYGYDV